MTQIDEKTAFVFAGGGSLGAVQVGMLGSLLAAGVRPDLVVGASVGAINASYFAGAPDAECVATLARLWSQLRRSDIFPFTLATALGLLRHPGNLVDPAGLRLNRARDVGEILGLRSGEIERKDRRLRVARGDDLVV